MTKRALISVSDKRGIVELARFLRTKGYRILSTGSTARLLKENGIDVENISDYTSFEEILDGRVKTLHPKIHAGILFKRENPKHTQTVERLNIDPIDVVVVNLYPFEEKATQTGDLDILVENIDIGGPAMLRAAAKNFSHVLVICDPGDYQKVMQEFDSIGKEKRFEFAMKAFSHTAYYDALIVEKLSKGDAPLTAVAMKKVADLRYGENPHQSASLYRDPLKTGVADARKLHGKELSYNNILDIDSAYRIMRAFEEPACAIIKHTSPCGVAIDKQITKAYEKALSCDPISAFGGIVGINTTVDEALAEIIAERFYEVVAAYGFTEKALEILKQKKNLRLVVLPRVEDSSFREIRSITGGYLVQESDSFKNLEYKTVSKKSPDSDTLTDLVFGFKVAGFVKSNAVVFAKNSATIAIGGGQTSRVDAVKCAIEKAKELNIDLNGSVMASDGFFPFRDSIDIIHTVGVKAVIAPSGSIRDKEIVEAADEHSMVLLFANSRHFRH